MAGVFMEITSVVDRASIRRESSSMAPLAPARRLYTRQRQGVLWRPVPPVSVRIRDLSGSAESVRIRDPRKRPGAVGRKSARTGLSDPARGPGGGPAAAVP